jgi:hypothetical protein
LRKFLSSGVAPSDALQMDGRLLAPVQQHPEKLLIKRARSELAFFSSQAGVCNDSPTRVRLFILQADQ